MKKSDLEHLKRLLEMLSGTITRSNKKMVIIENTEFYESYGIVFVEIWARSADLEVKGWKARSILVTPNGIRIAFEKV